MKDFCSYPDDSAEVSIDDILNKNTGNAIIAVSKEEYVKLRKLRTFPVIKELDFISNLRGELDLTANKKNIVDYDTGYPLLRGRNIGYYELLETQTSHIQSVIRTLKKRYFSPQNTIMQRFPAVPKLPAYIVADDE